MARHVDQETLLGFVAEARGYLPTVRQALDNFHATAAASDLAEAYRLVHTIKGAAAMVGLSNLSHVAYKLETVLEDLSNGSLRAVAGTGLWLRELYTLLELYLESVEHGEECTETLLGEAERLEQALRFGESLPAGALPPVDQPLPEPLAQLEPLPEDFSDLPPLPELPPLELPEPPLPEWVQPPELLAELPEPPTIDFPSREEIDLSVRELINPPSPPTPLPREVAEKVGRLDVSPYLSVESRTRNKDLRQIPRLFQQSPRVQGRGEDDGAPLPQVHGSGEGEALALHLAQPREEPKATPPPRIEESDDKTAVTGPISEENCRPSASLPQEAMEDDPPVLDLTPLADLPNLSESATNFVPTDSPSLESPSFEPCPPCQQETTEEDRACDLQIPDLTPPADLPELPESIENWGPPAIDLSDLPLPAPALQSEEEPLPELTPLLDESPDFLSALPDSNDPAACSLPELPGWQRKDLPAAELPPIAPEAELPEPLPVEPAPPAAAATAQEEIAPELLEVFQLEAAEHLRTIQGLLPVLEQQPDKKASLQEIRRSAHTLKGAAGMVGFRNVTQLAHRMEDALDLLYEGTLPLTPEVLQLLCVSADALEDLAAGRTASLEPLYQGYEAFLGQQAKPAPASSTQPADTVAPPAAEVPPETREAAPNFVERRVRFAESLDALVKLVSEQVIARTVFEQRMADFLRLLNELQPSTERLRRVSHRLETQYEASALSGGSGQPGKGGFHNRLQRFFQSHGFDELEFDRYSEFHLLRSRDKIT
jgi:chemotaxis protein histidine kinase CheA